MADPLKPKTIEVSSGASPAVIAFLRYSQTREAALRDPEAREQAQNDLKLRFQELSRADQQFVREAMGSTVPEQIAAIAKYERSAFARVLAGARVFAEGASRTLDAASTAAKNVAPAVMQLSGTIVEALGYALVGLPVQFVKGAIRGANAPLSAVL